MKNYNFQNDIVQFDIQEGILFGTYKVSRIDLEAAKKATYFRKQITLGKKFPSIADVSSVKEVTIESREYFSGEAGDDLSALAVIVSNPVTKMLANFFLKFHHPKYPFKFFSDTSSAVLWISDYK